MATIFPPSISNEQRMTNPHRRAEFLLYDRLSEQLGDQWVLIYGSAIKWKHDFGISDREVEFIVAHPSLGILAIEVKGGSITKNSKGWFSTPISESNKLSFLKKRYKIKNPYEQVTNTAKAYERKIQDYLRREGINGREVIIATAVCFPDIDIPSDTYLGPDALRELTICRSDLPNLKDRLYQILKLYNQQKRTSGLIELDIDILKNVLANDWHIESFQAYLHQSAEDRRIKLTEEQSELLDCLEENPKMLISGCAGSGKTLIAMRKAVKLASNGKKVLLTCYNKNLAEWMRRTISKPGLYITHFHGLEGKTKQKSYDAIIVDEGQDFEPVWFIELEDLLIDPINGIYYIFYDDNQRIYKEDKATFLWPKFHLPRNMRNTDQVFKYVIRYYHLPNKIKPSGIEGLQPIFCPHENTINDYQILNSVLEKLEEQKVSLKDIVILTPRKEENSMWRNSSVGGRYSIVWDLYPENPFDVSCCTIYSFKGLERSVVILTEMEHLYQEKADQLAYIAMSRAKDLFIVLGDLR